MVAIRLLLSVSKDPRLRVSQSVTEFYPINDIASFSGNNKADLLITTKTGGVTQFGIYVLNGQNEYNLSTSPVQILDGTHPFLADINGDF